MVLVSGGIDDLCLKYFVEAGAMGVRRCKKADLKRIARATGGELGILKFFTSIKRGTVKENFAVCLSKVFKHLTKNFFSNMKLLLEHREEDMK